MIPHAMSIFSAQTHAHISTTTETSIGTTGGPESGKFSDDF